LTLLKFKCLNVCFGSSYDVIYSKILSKITYCSPAWRVFASVDNLTRLDAFIRMAKKLNYCSNVVRELNEPFDESDTNIFKACINNKHHVLHPILPPTVSCQYSLRPRAHRHTLPRKTASLAERNFMYRTLYKNSY